MLCCSKFDRYKLCRGKFIRSKFSCSNLGRSKFSRTKFGRSKFSRWIVQSYVFSEHAWVNRAVLCFLWTCREQLFYDGWFMFSCTWNSCVTWFLVQGTVVLCFFLYMEQLCYMFRCAGNGCICFFLYTEQLCDMFPCAGNGCHMFFPVYGTVVWHVTWCRERLSYDFSCIWNSCVTCIFAQGTAERHAAKNSVQRKKQENMEIFETSYVAPHFLFLFAPKIS
jgi:hypothetical protein